MNGAVVIVGEVNDGGRDGTEGGVVDEGDDPVLADAGVVLGAVVGGGEEVLGGGTDVDADAAAAMVPLRSHGFGGEPIVQIGRMLSLRVHRRNKVGVLEGERLLVPRTGLKIRSESLQVTNFGIVR